jgi:hypothetical protein
VRQPSGAFRVATEISQPFPAVSGQWQMDVSHYLLRLAETGNDNCPLGLDEFLGGNSAINLFCRRNDADAMDEVGGHNQGLE